MNKDNALLYIPFIQALAEGKVIEWTDQPAGGAWLPMPNPAFTWAPDHYRVKPPEPRTFYCYRHTSACENNMSRMFLSEKDRTDHLAFITISSANIELLTVKEVL